MRKGIIMVILIVTGLMMISASGEKMQSIKAKDVSAETQRQKVRSDMLQFTAGGHVLGFRKGEIFIASADHALRIEFVNSRLVSPEELESPDTENSCQASKPLGKVKYKNLWDGVTLAYENHSSGVVKSTYYIQTKGKDTFNPVDQIRLRYNVPVKVNESGNLLASFETGQMKESRPVAWQDVKGKKVPVEVSFRSLGRQEAGFNVGSYDPQFPLVIDPVLAWHTFMGSASTDYGRAIAVDTSGNVYVAGDSNATWGAPVNAYAGGYDVFAAKFNSNGIRQWHTFMGSADNDYGRGIAVDANGNIYVAGRSYATWGTPVNAFAGSRDAFVAKFNSNGIRQWHTFMGSAGIDEGWATAVDTSGNVYVAGFSNATWGAPVNAYAGGYDAFAAKFNSNGIRQWHTFMGSASTDFGRGIAVDTSGNVYVAGFSLATWGAPVNAHAGSYDAFAAKLNSSGVRQWHTFMGSSGSDEGYAIAADTSGNVYVTGLSNATWGIPINPYTGGQDAFAAKLNSSGALVWNTFMGSAGWEGGNGIVVDASLNVYVAGETSATWGTPLNPFAGGYDIFAVELSSSGVCQWNTFLGSASGDYDGAIAVDTSGNVYVAGYSFATWGTPVNGHAGGYDAFLAKLGDPEINIRQDSIDIPDGGSCDFGSHSTGTDTDKSFTIQNNGGADLTLTTPITISGANADQFSVQQQPTSPVAPGGSTTFIIRFSPTSEGTKTASISVANNDSDENPYDITFTGTTELKYILSIAAGIGGTTDPSPGIYSHDKGTAVTIKAIPEKGYRFDGWTGNVPSGQKNNSPLTVTMNSDKSITANFKRQYTLTIISGKEGTTDPLPGKYTYDKGTKVTVKALPEKGYRFSGWSGDVSRKKNPITVRMNSDKSIKANFVRECKLKLSSGKGGSTKPQPGKYKYDHGKKVTLEAIPESGYKFSHWSGDISRKKNPITVKMGSDKSIKANFIEQYTLTTAAGEGGTTDPAPGIYTYDSGAEVTIAAIPESGYRFSGWSGDASGTDNPVTITMDSDKSITANFIRIIYPPLNFTGRKELNRSLSQAEYINVLTWQANPNNENTVKYRIYLVEGGIQSLLVELDANTFEYQHRNVEGGKQYTYAIAAVNDEDREGDPAYATIQ